MQDLLIHWSNLFEGTLKDNSILIDNSIGKGLIDAFALNENTQLFRIRLDLESEIIGMGYFLNDEEDYLPLIIGDASSMVLEGDMSVTLNGVFTANTKQGIEWMLKPKKNIQLLLLRVRYSYFNELLNRVSVLKTIFPPDQPYFVFEEMTPLMKGTFYRMFEIENTPFQKELLFGCQVYLFHLLMDKLSKREEIKEENRVPINVKGVFHARALITETKGAPLDIDLLAKECGMSSSSLRLHFKNSFGIPLYQYQQQIRLDEAKMMLVEAKKSMSMIAVELGFSNSSHFSSVFKKEFKMTPKQYQTNQRMVKK